MRRTALVLAGLMALAVLVPSPAAVGQVMGLYYQEVEKDGRIYIFNTPEKYNAFQQSGDMGIAVTLIGRGANGETLVGENETAIDLYLFRHNLPAYERPTPKAPAPPDPNAWYNKIKVSGYVFGDGYYVANHHDPVAEDVETGFWIRRAYLTFDNTFNSNFSARLRFEMNSPGDFRATGNITPFVKDAWLNYKRNDAFSMVMGIQPTPTFEVIETFWGYRSVEKTPVDLQRLMGSRDLGLGFKGALSNGMFKYHFLAANGGGNTEEVNDGKLAALSLGFYPTPNFFFEAYGDTEDRPLDEERQTLQGFLGFQGDWGRVGAQYVKQNRSQPGKADIDIAIASGFVVFKLNPKWAFYARYDDTMDPNPGASGIAYLPMVNNAKSQLAILGADWQVAPKLNLQPNIEHVTYNAVSGPDPDDDTLVRLTMFWQF
jgi:phosphate-selective porin O/P